MKQENMTMMCIVIIVLGDKILNPDGNSELMAYCVGGLLRHLTGESQQTLAKQ